MWVRYGSLPIWLKKSKGKTLISVNAGQGDTVARPKHTVINYSEVKTRAAEPNRQALVTL